MRAQALPLAAALALAVSSISCIETSPDHLTYRIEIKPTESGIERRITIHRTMNADSTQTPIALRVEAEVADRLGRVYCSRPNSEPPESLRGDTVTVYTGSGRFATIPDDIANWGTLRRFDSYLGRGWLYTEQFRTPDDPAAMLETNLAAADSVADIVVGWAESELGQFPRWPDLRAYLDRDIRRELRDCAARLLDSDTTGGDQNFLETLRHPPLAGLWWMSLVLAYDARPTGGPFKHEEVTDEAFYVYSLHEARKLMGEKLGLRTPAEFDKSFRFMSCPDSALFSLASYISNLTGESLEDAAARWMRVARPVFQDPYPEDGFSGWDSLIVELEVPPDSRDTDVDTDGVLNSALGKIVWASRVPKHMSRPGVRPLISSAMWQEPAVAAQERLFGGIRLYGTDLFYYCLWFSTLDSARQAEWNGMLTRLRPGKMEPLVRFRFSGGYPPDFNGEILGKKMLYNVAE